MKKYFHKIHIYLSVFFLPVAIMYAITGALYICGINENAGAEKQTYNLRLDKAIAKDKLGDFLIDYLTKNNIKLPSDTSIKEKRGNVSIGGIYYSANIKSLDDNIYEITTIQRSLYGTLLLLHKAKGAFYFNILGVGFALTLLVLYISGFVITSFCKKNRKESFIVFGIGALTMIILAYLSV